MKIQTRYNIDYGDMQFFTKYVNFVAHTQPVNVYRQNDPKFFTMVSTNLRKISVIPSVRNII